LKNKVKAKKQKKSKKTKIPYKIRNWSLYNKSLVKRGDITFWFSEEAINEWRYTGKQSQGSPKIYGDIAITTALTIRSLYSLTLRSTQGFISSLIRLMAVKIPVMDYTTICRRQKNLKIPCLRHRKSNGPIHVVVDSTGLKVFGEGEWKVRRHGYSKHRMWRKLHLAINPNTGEILSHTLTTNSVSDGEEVPALLNSITDIIASLTGDGAYDIWNVYNDLQKRKILPVIAPKINARIKKHGNSADQPLYRDEAIRLIRKIGRQNWKQTVEYHRRSLAETAMFRYKTQFGDKPLAHSLVNQKVEAAINCRILNQFTSFGRPDSYKIAA
jgi:hypothetical protein